MNPLQLSARYLKGYGANRGIQEAVDYGLGAAIGAGGQQLMNWATQGADPNPLLSGALFSPVGAALVRSSRGLNAMSREITRDFASPSGLFSGDKRNLALLENQLTNPYTQAALAGSLAGMVGGAGTSIYNTVAGGDDIDNNLVAAGVGTLGAIAPIAYSMLRSKSSPALPRTVYTMPSTSSGRYRAEEYTGVPSDYPRASANPDNLYQRPASSARTVDVPVETVTRPSILGNLPQGARGGDLAVVPRNSVVTVPPLAPWDIASLEYDVRKRGFSTPMTQNKYPYESGLYKTYDAL